MCAPHSRQKAAPVTALSTSAKIPLNRLQRIVAEKMVKQNIPYFYLNIIACGLVAASWMNKAALKLSFNEFPPGAWPLGCSIIDYDRPTGRGFCRLAASLDFRLAISTERGLLASYSQLRDQGV